jgi:hypothetical protein
MKERWQEDPLLVTFVEIEEHLRKLDPRQWRRLLLLLEHHIQCVLEERGVISDETPIPVAMGARLLSRTPH